MMELIEGENLGPTREAIAVKIRAINAVTIRAELSKGSLKNGLGREMGCPHFDLARSHPTAESKEPPLLPTTHFYLLTPRRRIVI